LYRVTARSRGLDRRAHVRRQQHCAAQSRRPPDRRRAAASIPHRLRIESNAGLAPARGPRARQRSNRQSSERVYRGAISPGIALGRTDMFRKLFMAATLAVFAIGGTTACASKKFVRTNVGQVNEKVDS